MIKYYLFLVSSIILTVIVQALLKNNSVKHSEELFEAVYDFKLYLVFFLYAIAMVFWYISSSKLQFTFMIPMHILTIIFGGIIGYYYFEESFNIQKISAYVLIIFGMIMLIYGNK
jgi:drug/metabolite transporter (DMT)-like permease